MNHPELTIIIEAGHIRDDMRTQKAFSNTLKMLAKTDAWVWLPVREVKEGGYAHCLVQIDGEDYIVMFSEDGLIKKEPGVSIASTSIQKMIEVVLSKDGPDGFVINPFTLKYRCIVSRRELEEILER